MSSEVATLSPRAVAETLVDANRRGGGVLRRSEYERFNTMAMTEREQSLITTIATVSFQAIALDVLSCARDILQTMDAAATAAAQRAPTDVGATTIPPTDTATDPNALSFSDRLQRWRRGADPGVAHAGVKDTRSLADDYERQTDAFSEAVSLSPAIKASFQ